MLLRSDKASEFYTSFSSISISPGAFTSLIVKWGFFGGESSKSEWACSFTKILSSMYIFDYTSSWPSLSSSANSSIACTSSSSSLIADSSPSMKGTEFFARPSLSEIKMLSRCLFWLQSIAPYSICLMILFSRYDFELCSIRDVTLLFWLSWVVDSNCDLLENEPVYCRSFDSSPGWFASRGLGTTPCACLLFPVLLEV